jgi:hypothetical protein
MKRFTIILLILIFVGITISSCSNMRLGTSVGLNMNFGPNGPYVQPHMNVGLYGGGYY